MEQFIRRNCTVIRRVSAESSGATEEFFRRNYTSIKRIETTSVEDCSQIGISSGTG